MRRIVPLILMLEIVAASASPEQLDLRALAKRARPAVVLILGFDASGKVTKTGSGFFASSDGRLVTNWHVIHGVSNAKAKTESGPVFDITGILAGSPRLDIAVLQANATDVPSLEINRERAPEAGTRIAVIGSPVALEGTLSEGIVSADRQDPNGRGTWIQITAPVSPGSSGSPVLDEEAKVVGIATLNSGGRYQNINFARSAEDIVSVFDIVPKGAAPMSFTRTAMISQTTDIVRGWIEEGIRKTTPPQPTGAPRAIVQTTPSLSPTRAEATPSSSMKKEAGRSDSMENLDGASLQKAATAGNVNAQVELGVRYLAGCKGFRLDYDKAAEWFQKAAKAGNPSAQFYLAFIYKEARGLPEDARKAAELNEQAAIKGNVTSQIALARQYITGDGVKPDYSKAAKLLLKAAESGHVVAQTLLGDLYAQGRGLPQDYSKAADLYEGAAGDWHAVAQAKLGDLYRRGKGVARDYAKAVEWCQKSGDQGFPTGLAYLGHLYATGEGVPRNYDKASELFQRGLISAGRNFSEPYREYAWFLATCPGEGQRDLKEAMRYATEACEIDNWKSARSLGVLALAYAESGDFEAAIRYEKKAQASGDQDADPDFEVALRAFAQKKPLRVD
jgi:TPR repeat protein/S1-C subfamily serine protease